MKLMKESLMKRVYWTWFLRKAILPTAVVLGLSGFILVKELSNVNVTIIYTNILQRLSVLDIQGLADYSIGAVRYTELDSLSVMIASSLLALFFVRVLLRDLLVFLARSSSIQPLQTKARRI